MSDKKAEFQAVFTARDTDLNQRFDPNLQGAPVLYVDGAQGFAVLNGVARFNLYQDRLTASPVLGTGPAETRIVAARIVMPVETAISLYKWLGDKVVPLEAQFQAIADAAMKAKDATGD